MKIFAMLAATTLTVISACAGKEPAPDSPSADSRSLSFAQDAISVEWAENAFTVGVNANFDYVVDIDVAWIVSDGSKTSTASQQHFIALENEYSAERTGTIRFTDKSDRYYTKSVTVTQAANPVSKVTLNIVDKDATAETKALLANLWAIADTGWMFGHHDDLWYGRYWYNEQGGSDTKAVCGDYPAVFSVDFGEVMYGSIDSKENQIRRRVILEARERGEVIMACAHLNNPKTGGDAWDNSSNQVVKEILTEGTETRTRYLSWLDRCAEFANGLKDSRNNLIPVIFRIYHEHTQGWSWWGSSCTTAQEFVDLWKFTVSYLRDTKGVHNFLYAVSPQMDGVYSNAQERIQYRWPGDDFVDFIGMDCYHGTNNDAFKSNLAALEAVSKAKRKPCGVTEDGKESFTETNFWSRYLMAPLEGRRISLVTMWRNKYVGNNEADKHYYSVYPGHPSEDDFRSMYDDPTSLFSKDLPDMYAMPAGYEIK